MSSPKLPLTQLFEIALKSLLEKQLGVFHIYKDICLSKQNTLWSIANSGRLFLVEPESQFYDDREWRADWKFPSIRVLVEVDGGTFKMTIAKKGKFAEKVFVGGRHNIGKGFVNDCEKLNAAAALGYRVYRIANERQINEVIDYLETEIKNYFASRTATGEHNSDHHQDTAAGKRTGLSELRSK